MSILKVIIAQPSGELLENNMYIADDNMSKYMGFIHMKTEKCCYNEMSFVIYHDIAQRGFGCNNIVQKIFGDILEGNCIISLVNSDLTIERLNNILD